MQDKDGLIIKYLDDSTTKIGCCINSDPGEIVAMFGIIKDERIEAIKKIIREMECEIL